MAVIEGLKKVSTGAVKEGEEYLLKSKRYFKLKIFQQIAFSGSMLIKILLMGSFGFIGIICFAAAAIIEIGKYFNSISIGCLIVGAIFFLLVLVVHLIRERIDKSIISELSDQFFD